MGITVHFEGRLRDDASLAAAIQVATDYARAKGWRVEPLEAEEVTLERVRDEEPWTYVGPVQGVVLYPHEDCEPVRLEFDRELYVQDYTKTQFAGPQVHAAVIDLLRRLEPLFRTLQVTDEAEFWESGDEAALEANFAASAKALAAIRERKPHARVKVRTPAGRILDMIG